MSEPASRFELDRLIRRVTRLVAVILTVWFLAYLSDVLIPFVLAVLLAYLLNPIVNTFEARLGRRSHAVALTLVLLGTLVGIVLPLLGWWVVAEVRHTAGIVSSPQAKEKLRSTIQPALDWVGDTEFTQTVHQVVNDIQPEQLRSWLIQLGQAALPHLWQLTSQAAGVIGSFIRVIFMLCGFSVIFLYLIFLLMDFRHFRKNWEDQLPPEYRAGIVEFVSEFSQAMGRYFRGQCVVAMCSAILYSIGFGIAGVPMAVLLGLLMGVLCMVPYLQIVGFIPAVLLALLQSLQTGGSPWWAAVSVILVFAVVQTLQDGFLSPRILGASTGLKPWMIMLSVFVWGKLLGFLGIFLAIPLSCLGLAYYRRYVLKKATNNPDGRGA